MTLKEPLTVSPAELIIVQARNGPRLIKPPNPKRALPAKANCCGGARVAALGGGAGQS